MDAVGTAAYVEDDDVSDTNADEDELFYFYLWTVATPTLFTLIVLVGAVGNVAVILVIVSQQTRHSPTNLLLVNLALADLAFLFVCVPVTAVKYAAMNWPFNDIACKVVQYLLYVTAYVTVYTLVAVSALRFVIVVCDSGRLVARWCRRPRTAILCSVTIWVAAATGNLPVAAAHVVKVFNDYAYCGIVDRAIGPIIVSFFVLGYVLPLSAISVLYLLIVRHLRNHQGTATLTSSGRQSPASGRRLSTGSGTLHAATSCSVSGAYSRSQARNARTLRLVVLVVVVFGVSWLPNHIQSLTAYLGLHAPSGNVYEVFRIFWNCMAYGNSCINPIIYHYGAMAAARRDRTVCGRCCCCCWRCIDKDDQRRRHYSYAAAAAAEAAARNGRGVFFSCFGFSGCNSENSNIEVWPLTHIQRSPAGGNFRSTITSSMMTRRATLI